MPATTIRIRPASYRALKEMAAMTGRSVQDLLDEAIEERQRRLYLVATCGYQACSLPVPRRIGASIGGGRVYLS